MTEHGASLQSVFQSGYGVSKQLLLSTFFPLSFLLSFSRPFLTPILSFFFSPPLSLGPLTPPRMITGNFFYSVCCPPHYRCLLLVGPMRLVALTSHDLLREAYMKHGAVTSNRGYFPNGKYVLLLNGEKDKQLHLNDEKDKQWFTKNFECH